MHHRSTARPPTTSSPHRDKPKTSRSLRSLCAIGTIALIATSCGSDASDDADASESAAPVSEAASETTLATPTTPAPTTTIAPKGTEMLITATSDFAGDQVVGTFDVPEGADGLGCDSGSFVDTDVPTGVRRLATCESGDRAGTFTVHFVPGDGPGPGDLNGPWNVEGATGDFAGLQGEGDFSVVFNEETESGAETLGGSIEFGPVDETSSTESDPPDEAADGMIRVETEINWGDAQATGSFEVAEGADLLGCSSGTAIEYDGPSGITNVFTCEDGDRDGTFTLRWQIEDDAVGPGDVNGPWSVVESSGDFAGLTGDGLWSGTATDSTGFGSFPGSIEFGPVIDTSDEPVDDRPHGNRASTHRCLPERSSCPSWAEFSSNSTKSVRSSNKVGRTRSWPSKTDRAGSRLRSTSLHRSPHRRISPWTPSTP